MIIKTIKQLKRLFIAIAGSTILLIGILLIVLPGPAFIIIPLGLSILASEFLWAKRLMDRLKEKLAKVFTKV
jgi:tellurite resistance protein TerC